jgi:predicted Zn finger-like uncharacterized protein
MLIVCPSCSTCYLIEPSSLGPAGRSVRCVRCRNVWFEANTAALSAIAEAHRADMAVFATEPPATGYGAEAADPQWPMPEPGVEPDSATAFEADPFSQSDAALPDAAALSDAFPGATPLRAEEPPAVPDAPPLAPTEDAEAGNKFAPEDLEPPSIAARRGKRAPAPGGLGSRLPGLPATILALVAVIMALIGWRSDMVRLLPQTASFYAAIGLPVNLRGLAFSNVTTTKESQDGMQILLVEGTIVSTSLRPTDVPRLRFALRNASGHEIYTWTALPSRSVLAPGETLAFRSRLASPPEARDVLVRFFNRRDLVAGIQ